MTRYTTKHFWRMEESEEGEWVRYEEHQKLIEDYYKIYYKIDKSYIDRWESMAIKSIRHLESRLLVLFWLVMGAAAYAIARLIGWSLGL